MSSKQSQPRITRGASYVFLLGSLFASSGLAQTAVTETDFLDDLPVVLSASRLSQPVSEAPVAVTVIDQEMIRASGFRDIPELLRLVPGFSVAYTANNTWTAGYHGLADAYSRRFQVLVDGRSIYSPHYGTVYWTDLPLAIEDIERIEVVRGPNAAIHGANAFLAVINIITKTAAQVPGEFVSMQVGEQDMGGLTLRHGGGGDSLRYRLTASAQQRDRFEKHIVGLGSDDGTYYEATQTYFVNGRFDWQLAPDSDLMLQFGVSRGNWDAGSRQPAYRRSYLQPLEQDSRALYLHLAYHKVESERREWRLQAYHTQNRFDADTTSVVDGKAPVAVDQYLSQSRSNLELQVNEQWAPALRAVWGGELRRETAMSPQAYNSDRTLSGELARAFGNLEWRAHERVLLQGGAMLEHHYYTGTDISPRAALNLTLAPDHVLRFGISRAYRSPTFFEEEGNQVYLRDTGAYADIVTVPSTGLAPERILSREIGYVGYWRPVRMEVDVRLFRDKINDFIGQQKSNYDSSDSNGSNPASPAFDPAVLYNPGNEFQYQNLGSVKSRGGELQLRWRPVGSLDVSAHYARTYLSANTARENYNVDIPQSAPRNSWGVLADYRFGTGWEASVGAWHTDPMKWLTEGDATAAYTRVDARVARRWKWQGREVEAALVGQNLGRDYTEFRRTNVFSQRVYGSLGFTW